MKGNLYLLLPLIVAVIFLTFIDLRAETNWETPFDTTENVGTIPDSLLSLSEVLSLVASANPALKSFMHRREAAVSNLKQAGLRPNPEFSANLEEFGWNSPGFKELELTVVLSQEFDFFGQRSAKKKLAQSELEAFEVAIKQSVFDLYLEAKKRFYSLAHAQYQVALSKTALELANEIVNNITYRLERGASLQSELLLAELESKRASLSLNQAKQNALALETELVTLWQGTQSGITLLISDEPDFNRLHQVTASLVTKIDSSREIIRLKSDARTLQAQKVIADKEAMPTITLSGGFKHLEINNSKSFLIGFSMPLPLFNRNQGEKEKIAAELRSLEYDIEFARDDTKAYLQSQLIRLDQLIDKHSILDNQLLPTARKAYNTLQESYTSGRIPYTQLLEAERSLNELSFEHNDMLLAIQEQIITLEKVTGIELRLDKEN